MLQLSQICCWTLVAMAAYNTFWALLTALTLRRRRPPLARDQELPKAAILLSLRGADPGLADTLRRLLAQDYPAYDLLIAVDSQQDPAWQIVADTVRQCGADNVRISPLRNRLSSCSLKCSSLVQLLDQLDDTHEMVVLADADLQSHSTWLRELIGPMVRDPRLGATFGNRWFLPADGQLGSLVRQLCNAPSIVVMFAAQIPWGGSLAIRRSVVQAAGLRRRWSRAIVDDGPVRAAVKEQGMKIRFVPSLLMANRERCDLPFAFNFLRRQLTWTSTYIRSWWPLLLGYTVVSIGIWLTAVCLAGWCLARGLTAESVWFGAGALAPCVMGPLQWLLLDGSARTVIRRQGEPVAESTKLPWRRLPLVSAVAACLHLAASLAATFQRRIVWRGVRYEILGPWKIRVLDDSAVPAAPTSPGVSI